MAKILSLIASKYFLWMLIAFLALPPILQLLNYPLTARQFHDVMHESGEAAIRLMLLAMMVSPIRLIFPENKFVLWMARNRRYFGVGAFCLVLVHVTSYVLDKKLPGVIEGLSEPRLVAGWTAFIIFIPLAATSTNWAVKKLGGVKWKRLHQAIYLAAAATAIHWLLLHHNEGVVPALVHFTPLVLLESYRIFHRYGQNKRMKAA